MSFDRLELPCIWIPEGGELPATLPWGNPAIFRAMFIPDGHEGPRPGYPWIEFGRMSLRVGSAGGTRQAPSAATRQSRSVPDAEPRAAALDPPVVGSFAPPGGNSDETSRATKVYPDLGATVRSWTAISDVSATKAALDVLSPNSPYVRGLTGMGQGGLPGERSRSEQVWPAAATESYARHEPGTPGGSATQVEASEPEEQRQAPPDPGRDAIRPVYPLETALGIAAAALTGGATAAARAAGGAILRRIMPRPSPGETPASILFPGDQPIGLAGTSEPIRELSGGRQAAEELFKRLTQGGEDVTPPDHPGTLVQAPDGSYIGYRPNREAVRQPSM
jgi:hypothetical protein